MQPVMKIWLYIPSQCRPLAFGYMTEPFYLANQMIGYEKYQLNFIAESHEGINVYIQSDLNDKYSLSDIQKSELLVIYSECKPNGDIGKYVRKNIQRIYHQTNTDILSIQAGAYWFADAGLYAQSDISIHWTCAEDFHDQYESLCINRHIYSNHGRLLSCAGQSATLDSLLNWIEKHEGSEISGNISEILCLDRIRCSDEKQRIPLQQSAADLQPKLAAAIELMESNTEEPLSTDEIADLIHISRRQLERIFKKYLNNMPAKYYLEIRLKRAKQLLLNSSQSIVQIGLCCGFSSGPHFSSAYKSYFQITPRDERIRKINQMTIATRKG